MNSRRGVRRAGLPFGSLILFLGISLLSCAPNDPEAEVAAADTTAVAPVPPEPAPWLEPPLAWSDVPAAYEAAWEQADNRETCAPLAPSRPLSGGLASVRQAQFGGGWGVAYDLPEQRSAFGIAGTGVTADAPAYEGFPHTLGWTDGAVARYGPEGGTGPNHLAYLRIPGQGCLYNVWSAIGRDHLEEILGSLRFVDTGGSEPPA